MKQFDIVVLPGRPALSALQHRRRAVTVARRRELGANGKPRTRVPRIASHLPLTEPVIA